MLRCWGLLVLVSLLQGCAAFEPVEAPLITIERVQWAPDNGTARFAIGLHVINPGRRALTPQGIVYTLSIDDVDLIQGVANELPEIEAYGQADVVLFARPNLINGLRLLGRMLTATPDTVHYRLEAEIDLGGLYPIQRVVEQGSVDLQAR